MSTPNWTIKRMLDWSDTFLRKYGSESPRLDAELLLCETLGLQRMDLYVQFDRPIEAGELSAYKGLIKRRAAHEPVAYILGNKGFHAIDLDVGPGILVPRPETEHLVDVALSFLAEEACPVGPVVDVGTGSGAIALAVATGLPQTDKRKIFASDTSPVAVDFATRNTARLQLAERVTVLQGDLLTPAVPHGPFAAIVSNPPYIRSDAMAGLERTVRDHEPHLALDGGEAGLEILRRLVDQSVPALLPGGLFAVELGSRQQGQIVAQWLTGAGMKDAAYEPIGPGPTGIVSARAARHSDRRHTSR
ncbi:MAG: peptide chain release factor N(5)-glutamine methyltransferase [Myxococcales bacterium]|nr:peptide chain release factor N(5)-glutamine methyltransferase [Myxococcales bacterium]